MKGLIDLAQLFMDIIDRHTPRILELFTYEIGDVVPVGLRPLTDPLLDTLGIGDFSLLAFIFGAGAAVYLAWQFTTWLLNLIT